MHTPTSAYTHTHKCTHITELEGSLNKTSQKRELRDQPRVGQHGVAKKRNKHLTVA